MIRKHIVSRYEQFKREGRQVLKVEAVSEGLFDVVFENRVHLRVNASELAHFKLELSE